MIHLPRQVEYALMALAEMNEGQPTQLFSVRSLTTTLGIPYDMSSKAMQALVQAGILRSVQGKYGGYQVARDLETVTLEELMGVLVGPQAIADCLKPGHVCPQRNHCSIRRGVIRIEAKTRAFLQSISVQEMITP